MTLKNELCSLLHSGECLACRTEPINDLACWLVITPFKINPETGMSTLNAPSEPWRYRVRHFGILADFDYTNYDLHPEYVTNFTNEIATSVEQIGELVANIIDDSSSLVHSRNCDCPL